MSHSQFVTQRADGDGNCSFNAFILGLAEASVLNNLLEQGESDPDRRYAEFIKRAQTVFPGKPLTWLTLKNALINDKAKDSLALQHKLAPVMRAFALDLIRQDKEAYFNSTVNALQDELESYFKIMRNRFEGKDLSRTPIDHRTPEMGDIFIRHKFVKEAFAFLWDNFGLPGLQKQTDQAMKVNAKALQGLASATVLDKDKALSELEKALNEVRNKSFENILTKAKKILVEKWMPTKEEKLLEKPKKAGIDMFLEAMSQHGVNAGDLELAPLAKYFGISLDVDMGRRGHHAIGLVRRMPEAVPLTGSSAFRLERATCIKLSSRGIMDVDRNLEPISHAEVDSALGAIPDCAVVTQYINDNQPVKGAPVPNTWSGECKQQLLKRGVIARNRAMELVFASNLSDDYVETTRNSKTSRIASIEYVAAFPWGRELIQEWASLGIITQNGDHEYAFASDISNTQVETINTGRANRAATLERIAAFPYAKEIAATWKAVPTAPKITLRNTSAVHWDNVVLQVVPNFDIGDYDFGDSDDEDDNRLKGTGNHPASGSTTNSTANNTNTASNSASSRAASSNVALGPREALTRSFLRNSSSFAVIDEILSCRKKLDEGHAEIKQASVSLFSYANSFKKPEKSDDRYAIAVRYHVMLGLYKWADYCSKRLGNSAEQVATLRTQAQTELTKLAEKFPKEFSLLSDQDDWNVVKSCLSERVAKNILAIKLNYMEKIFKTYDDKNWRALVARLHSSYVKAFNRDRLPKLKREAFGELVPLHFWQPAPREKANESTNPYAGKELGTPPQYVPR